MNLNCQTGFLILAATTIACSEPLTPSSVSGFYVLESVNGQPLPAILSPIPEATISVIYGTVTLMSDANAFTVERRREVRQNVPSERTYTSNLRFVLDGNRIGFIIDCPPNANCISIEGLISGSSLEVAYGGFASPNRIVYAYRLEPVGVVPAN